MTESLDRNHQFMDIGRILTAIKLSPRYLLPISLASGFLLYAEPSRVTGLGLDSFVDSYRPWIGVTFLLASALLVSHVGIYLWSASAARLVFKRRRAVAKKRLSKLTLEEKGILRGFILGQTRSQHLDISSGVVSGLEAAGIIYRASSLGSLLDGFAYNIHPWAWDYLNANVHLLLEPDEF